MGRLSEASSDADLCGFWRGVLAWRKVVSSVFLNVISFLGKFSLPPLQIPLTLRELLHPGSVGRVGSWVIERVCVERVGGAERVLGIAC